jgi:hypothetical protein
MGASMSDKPQHAARMQPADAGRIGSPASSDVVSNRRREPRAPHRLPCRVRFFDAGRGEWIAKLGNTVNLSATGLAVQVGMPMTAGARVEAVLPRFEDDPLCIVGTVVHTRRVMTGTFEVGIATKHAAPLSA